MSSMWTNVNQSAADVTDSIILNRSSENRAATTSLQILSAGRKHMTWLVSTKNKT